MRRRRLITGLVVVGVLGLQGLAACGNTDNSAPKATSSAAALPSRTIEAGEVTVKITPRRIDASGAEFKLTFDTHSVELGFDLERIAHLTIGDTKWPTRSWSGDGPGGHHREGTIRFTAAGAALGRIELRLEGLPSDVKASWRLPNRQADE